MDTKPLKTFIIYAHQDQAYHKGLESFLRHLVRKGKITIWSDKEIKLGEYWDESIKLNLDEAELIIMLVSVDFYNSDYIQDVEFQRAKKRHDRGEALVIPVLVRSCPWKSYDFVKDLQVLPTGAKSIDTWRIFDQAFTDVAEKIEVLVTRLLNRRVEENNLKRKAEEQIREAINWEERTRRNDEEGWKVALETIEAATELKDKIAALDFYLNNGFTLHANEAQQKRRLLDTENIKRNLKVRTEKSKGIPIDSIMPVSRKKSAKVSKYKNGHSMSDMPDMPELVFVETGRFQMGTEEGENTEKPAHTVTLESFWMSKYLITFDDYEIFCIATGRTQPSDEGWGYRLRPVINVSWEEASYYCEWLSDRTGYTYRLPTEAEWEFAAKGGTLSKGYRYAGKNDLYRVGWFFENSGNQTHPVGQKEANELGLYDMSGNVWEWCFDNWHNDYQGAPYDGSAWLSKGEERRVLRGGYHNIPDSSCRITCRFRNKADFRSLAMGFRVVREV